MLDRRILARFTPSSRISRLEDSGGEDGNDKINRIVAEGEFVPYVGDEQANVSPTATAQHNTFQSWSHALS